MGGDTDGAGGGTEPRVKQTVDQSLYVAHKLRMPAVRRTPEFDKWLRALDNQATAIVIARIDRLELGNAGDVSPVGSGVSEMRIHYGPGFRVYFKQRGETITLLIGGTKRTQRADIGKAKALANKWGD